MVNNVRLPLNYLIIFILLCTTSIFAQLDTTKYQWPILPMTSQRNIGGAFGEYRSTSVNGHYHNGTDISASGGTSVVAVLPGIVAAAYDDGSTGYDSYVRITSQINGKSKNITYYHTRPVVSVGQQVSVGQTISKIAIDHVHLIDYRIGSSLSNSQLNAIRPGGGITIYSDPWPPHIRYVKFFLDGTNTQLSPNNLGSKIDIITHIEEVNGTSSASLNNGTYELGYKILSADSQVIVYNPPDDGLRYKYYNIPKNAYVNINYYQPESNTSKHVYIATNGTGASDVASTQVVKNNYWDTESFSYGNYVVMVFTEDVRGNTDTVYIPVTTKEIDLTPPAAPQLKYVEKENTDTLSLAWEKPPDEDLMGYRLYFTFDGSTYQQRDNENTLLKDINFRKYYYSNDKAIYFKITSVDSSFLKNESEQSDVYGLRMLNDNKKILIVDGFDRQSGNWNKPYHDFVIKYGESFDLSFSSCSNDEIINSDINLNDFDLVIWILGDESSQDETFSQSEQAKVSNYLESGGDLFVSGSNIAFDLEGDSLSTNSDKLFLHNYLKAKYVLNSSNINFAVGKDSTNFSGISFGYGIPSQGSPYRVTSPDVIDTTGGSIPIFSYSGNGIAGIEYSGNFNSSSATSKIIYLAFPFETIPSLKDRTDLMNKILIYFDLIEPTLITDKNIRTNHFNLSQNYPNPFNPSTKIKYTIAPQNPAFRRAGSSKGEAFGNSTGLLYVTLKIYDILGNEVAVLVNKNQSPGNYQIQFNAKNSINGTDLSSGIYFYRLIVTSAGGQENFQQTKKMILLR